MPKAASELLELLVLLTCWRARRGRVDIMLLWAMDQGAETSGGNICFLVPLGMYETLTEHDLNFVASPNWCMILSIDSIMKEIVPFTSQLQIPLLALRGKLSHAGLC